MLFWLCGELDNCLVPWSAEPADLPFESASGLLAWLLMVAKGSLWYSLFGDGVI